MKPVTFSKWWMVGMAALVLGAQQFRCRVRLWLQLRRRKAPLQPRVPAFVLRMRTLATR